MIAGKGVLRPRSANALFSLKAELLLSAEKLSQCPSGGLPEVAFSGRSNVGKSSLVNALTGLKHLARVSNTPGRTQTINFFKLSNAALLVDLPGYGYAKAPVHVRRVWSEHTQEYLLHRQREQLRNVYVLLDSRRAVLENDLEWLSMLHMGRVPFTIVLTKIDTLSASRLQENYESVRAQVQLLKGGKAVQSEDILSVSSKTGNGIKELKASIYNKTVGASLAADSATMTAPAGAGAPAPELGPK